MNKIDFNELEYYSGGGICKAIAVADAVVAVGGAGAWALGIVLSTPVGVGVSLVLAGGSVYCAFK